MTSCLTSAPSLLSALIHFHGNMRELLVLRQQQPDLIRRYRPCGFHAQHTGKLSPAHTPHVQILDRRRHAAASERIADLGHHGRVHLRIEQYATGIAQQGKGPCRYDEAADDAHDRIEPNGAQEFAADQRADRQ